MPVIEINTDRLLIRPIGMTDCDALFRYKSDIITNQYQGWVPKQLVDVHNFVKNKISPAINIADTWYQLAIVIRENGTLIGDIGLHFIDQENKQVEIGFSLDKNYHGKGYATEATEKVIEYLFKKLNKHRIIASIDPENVKSLKLLERLGFRKEAHFKKSIFFKGKWVDDVIYAILHEEWIIR